MSVIIVSPLSRIAELAVRHKARDMISLIAKEQAFHRPGVIAPERHLTLAMNDIAFKGTGGLVAPDETHVRQLIDFATSWRQETPLLIHCWMGVSRSPAAALIAALSLAPDQKEEELARRLRAASPFATPNARLIEIGDALLERGGRLVAAVRAIGRGADADGNTPFVLAIRDTSCG
ncbi:tyrosine phosphatase family protein [Rhizobium binae]|uniref:tyrosine phosphatase family protein n=1 Tax=Rhizobium binae TaxID=1138190 RepID=UPI001C831006|nr:tyrosine phosphatase family protein [Rhizobium binae]MBX4928322.1 protein tyrosine phosphatase [Rhizobium binae]MBX4936661.1 protein tyrosine phosphatase [Rhizobium binae]MBX4942985.1 protein tyrosine phosphatase [Rhizobium binae]MBX4951502.1 protein tyrosine phosphatase [Rhizobium binae]MBX4964227.1 protein tyrosine phosphatase [Rhizobium binae]